MAARRSYLKYITRKVSSDPSLDHVLSRLAVTEARVRDVVLRRRGTPREGPDPFRGLYLSGGKLWDQYWQPARPAA